MTPKLTAVVFSYNRRDIIETTLRSVRFADHLVVIDKSSNDGTAEIARAYADEFNSIPWSPTIEETKAEYIPKIDSEWLIVIDDDECLNLEAIAYCQVAIRKGEFDLHYFPLRHYVLGQHDERAYYWPEHHPILFRQGAMRFEPKIHGGKIRASDNHVFVDPATGVAILHLSHPDVASWLEKTNRYTEQRDRASAMSPEILSPDGVAASIRVWLESLPADSDAYLTSVTVLRAIYDLVDAIKQWEQQGIAGQHRFATICESLNRDYDALGIGRREPLTTP